MLNELLEHLRNWFLAPGGIHAGTYTIRDGSIALPFLQAGQCYRIVGSVFNDGVYFYGDAGLMDETFTGSVWALAVPREVLNMEMEISAWVAANPMSAVTSESFGGYSYQRATGAGDQPVTWQEVFRSRLNRWRKM